MMVWGGGGGGGGGGEDDLQKTLYESPSKLGVAAAGVLVIDRVWFLLTAIEKNCSSYSGTSRNSQFLSDKKVAPRERTDNTSTKIATYRLNRLRVRLSYN